MPLQLDPTNYGACPAYNQWLDESYADDKGELDIVGFKPRPSEVLFQMSPVTYEATFADFLAEREGNIKEAVFQRFPSPVAHYFYRFENGYESELQRLHLLRDTWESLVDIIHAITVSECKFRGLTLVSPATMGSLLSESVAQRLTNIEVLMQQAAAAGSPLKISQLVPASTVQSMRTLNQVRNGFSHSAAQSEAQALTWIGECYEDIIDVLEGLQRLSEVTIYRYLSQTDGLTLRCEVFSGHAPTKTIKAVPLVAAQVAESQQFFQPGQLLVLCDGDLFGLRP